MRSLRLTLVGVLASTLLGGLGGAVSAQDDASPSDPDDFVYVTGVERGGSCDEGECLGAKQDMSDPRVSGALVVQLDLGCSDKMVCWMGGDLTITNEGGTWDGRWVGFINSDAEVGRSHDIMQWFEGNGAYEGWSYVAVLSDFDRPGRDVRGVVYRGELPPSVAQGLELPAE